MQAATVAPEGIAVTPTKEQLLALRMVAYGLSTDHLELLTSLLLSGRMTFNFLHDHWNTAVLDYLDGKPLMGSLYCAVISRYGGPAPPGTAGCLAD